MTESTSASATPVLVGTAAALVFAAAIAPYRHVLQPTVSYKLPFSPDPLTQTGMLDNTSIRVYGLRDKAEILSGFLSRLLTETIDLKPEAVNAINDNFWSLF